MKSKNPGFLQLTRRRLLELLGGASVAALSGCGGSGTSATSSTGSTSASGSSGASCVLTPELTVGPYFVDEKLNRSDLTTNTTDANVLNAIPLSLVMTILQYASSGCSALAGAQVDVWQADAAGLYSDESVENTVGQTVLRGSQITDSNGAVTFKTIIPGWYSGRTVHIHVMIRTLSTSGAVLTEFTIQLFFAQTFLERAGGHSFSLQFTRFARHHKCPGQHLFPFDRTYLGQRQQWRRLHRIDNARSTNDLASGSDFGGMRSSNTGRWFF
jgi:protocatechuate 3,4-dioxygenase beta subunit